MGRTDAQAMVERAEVRLPTCSFTCLDAGDEEKEEEDVSGGRR